VDDRDRLPLLVAGEPAAWGAFVRDHAALLRAAVVRVLGPRGGASGVEPEDVVQAVFYKLWEDGRRRLRGFQGKSRLSTWLVRIVANDALGRLRRSGAHVIPLEAAMTSPEPELQTALTDAPDRGPEHCVLRAQVRELMESRIDLLPEVYRTVFTLRAVEELEIPEATVRTRYFRARGLLREGLAGAMDSALAEVFSFDGARCDRIVTKVLAAARIEGRNRQA
jgi:RNA polymerase sigma-70 factor (ECF subfamily)